MNLAQKSINDADTNKLSEDQIREYLSELPDWEVKQGRLFRHYEFANFNESKAFVDKVAQTAEEAGHHPDIKFSFKYAELEIFTHKIGGLTEADFILAARISRL